jgi:hypothetical protein
MSSPDMASTEQPNSDTSVIIIREHRSGTHGNDHRPPGSRQTSQPLVCKDDESRHNRGQKVKMGRLEGYRRKPATEMERLKRRCDAEREAVSEEAQVLKEQKDCREKQMKQNMVR